VIGRPFLLLLLLLQLCQIVSLISRTCRCVGFFHMLNPVCFLQRLLQLSCTNTLLMLVTL